MSGSRLSSWSGIRRKLEQDYLCPALRGRIQYFAATYHAGKGCTIGTTMTITDKVVPNLVGVDIGCGMETVRLRETRLEWQKLDKLIREKIPSGFAIREKAHRYAGQIDLNRLCCAPYLDLPREERFTTIHNYIDTDAMILRKGAVSARAGEKLLIPINMRDGSLICLGRGNEDWNFSAPHGAGRLMSRAEAKQSFTVSEFKKQMAGVYTTSVGRATLDECPMAYKGMQDILDNIGPTAQVLKIIRPLYNFKAGDED